MARKLEMKWVVLSTFRANDAALAFYGTKMRYDVDPMAGAAQGECPDRAKGPPSFYHCHSYDCQLRQRERLMQLRGSPVRWMPHRWAAGAQRAE